ncbi:substrate-binding domain-containing protein [Rhodococcus sp. NPDC057014]|uniref:substrate-binding domain-containing protein n=1 Tax=Rhodococcus sp. NPDC057014 TaxID=3346000 RepID=UPI00363A7890
MDRKTARRHVEAAQAAGLHRSDGEVFASGVVTTYPIAVLKYSQNKPTAQEFTTFVTGPTGQRVLADAGFAAP